MGDYKLNPNDEKRPPSLFPEGSILVEVTEMTAEISKKGNNMMKTTITDIKTNRSMEIYLVNEPKKRWVLKTLLAACGLNAAQDGVYDWEIRNVVGKQVVAIIEHEDQDWINRDGETVKQKKAKVVEFLSPEKTAWENES